MEKEKRHFYILEYVFCGAYEVSFFGKMNTYLISENGLTVTPSSHMAKTNYTVSVYGDSVIVLKASYRFDLVKREINTCPPY